MTATITAPTARPKISANTVSTSHASAAPTPATTAAGSARTWTRWYGAVTPSSSSPTSRMWPPTHSMASMPTKEITSSTVGMALTRPRPNRCMPADSLPAR